MMNPRITNHEIARARQINLVDYLVQHGFQPVSRTSTRALFHSPLRDDTDPSFSVSQLEKGWFWHDFGTKERGDIIDFVRRQRQMSFRQAIQEILNQPLPQHPTRQQSSRIEKKSIKQQIANIRQRYTRARDAMTPERTRALQRLFAQHRLPWYEQLGAVWLLLQPDPQRPHFRRPYVALPFPTADVSTLQGLECRALGSIPRHLQRRTRSPQKTLWMLSRSHQPILLTESIFDCLAGDALFGPRFSLLALNGLPMLPQLPSFLSQLQPPAVYVVLDNDRKADRGPRAQQEAIQMITSFGIPAIDVRIHTQARVKDLAKLLRRYPKGLDPLILDYTGVRHDPAHVPGPTHHQRTTSR
ncbi:MAG: hypothetical protein NPIRA04_04080 [Nitrospirales bacterium]|nr:MAG: hypothetical protein NPIRA04_04080 [Nitrospirales bacterium]